MKISATYEDFPSIIEKVMIEIGVNIFECIRPITKETIVDGKVTTENLAEFKIVDDRMGYNWTYTFDKKEMKQFINLMQRLQLQIIEMDNENNSNENDKGQTCSRIKIK